MTDWSGASDEDVLAAYAAGTTAADRNDSFAELVDRFEHRVYGICFRYFGNRADAEDATQDTFLTVARRAETFAGRSKLSTWLYRVAVNACNDLARKRDRRPRTPIANIAEVVDRERSHPDEAGDAIAARETQLEVQDALLRLDDLSRTLIILVAIEERPYQEVAEILDMPVGTVKSRVHRARARLTDLLSTEPDGVTRPPTS